MKVSHKYRTLALALMSLFIVGGLVMATKHIKKDISPLLLLDKNYQPTSELLALLSAQNITTDYTLESIVEKTQKMWLRPVGKERWEFHQQTLEESREQLLPTIERIGCVQTIAPQKNFYDYVLILGATTATVRKRLSTLVEHWHSGLRCRQFVFLGSERPLDPTIETPQTLLTSNIPTLPIHTNWVTPQTLPQTEHEMMKFLWDQSDIPAEMRKTSALFINAPMKIAGDKKVRPTTGDTFDMWLKTNPSPGACLAISSQPYVGYQDAVLRAYLPATFAPETVGDASAHNERIAIYLDTIARWLYQELQLKKKVPQVNA